MTLSCLKTYVTGQQTHIPVRSLTAIPKVQGMVFTVQRKAVHLNRQIMAMILESSPLEDLDANRMVKFTIQFTSIFVFGKNEIMNETHALL